MGNGNHVYHHRRACILSHASLPGNGKSPALRPSLPHGCRKRDSVKAKPCRAASRALTFMPWLPASYTRGRRTRKPPAGAQSKEAPSRKHKDRDTKSVSCLSRFSRIATHGGNDTCKSVPAYAPQSFPDTYNVASRPASDARAVMRIMLTLPCVGY